MRFVGVIPARFQSARLPGKALISISGKPLIQWVYERASLASRLNRLIVATDDSRILKVVRGFGAEAVLTSSEHRSGTDRVAEVAHNVAADCFVNIQGDEPLIPPETIDALCKNLADHPDIEIATACFPISEGEASEPDVVKVVFDSAGRALYFSRAPIPFQRRPKGAFFKHLGIYGYRRDFLLELPKLQPSELEESEALEQLRFLENGKSIFVFTATQDSFGVDTKADIERVRPLLENVASYSECSSPGSLGDLVNGRSGKTGR
jgi:3-deoxy-manno-octulosonate cytidylyltransferase (CMP-KDO synthetase)